jgi:hypothetical protein
LLCGCCLSLPRVLGPACCPRQSRRALSYQQACREQHAIAKCFRVHDHRLLGTEVPLNLLLLYNPLRTTMSRPSLPRQIQRRPTRPSSYSGRRPSPIPQFFVGAQHRCAPACPVVPQNAAPAKRRPKIKPPS